MEIISLINTKMYFISSRKSSCWELWKMNRRSHRCPLVNYILTRFLYRLPYIPFCDVSHGLWQRVCARTGNHTYMSTSTSLLCASCHVPLLLLPSDMFCLQSKIKQTKFKLTNSFNYWTQACVDFVMTQRKLLCIFCVGALVHTRSDGIKIYTRPPEGSFRSNIPWGGIVVPCGGEI